MSALKIEMSALKIELIYAVCMFKGAELIDQVKLILNKFEQGDYALSKKEKRNVNKRKVSRNEGIS